MYDLRFFQLKFFLLFMVLSIWACSASEPISKDQAVKESIVKMFEDAKANNYEKLARSIAYRGADPERKWKDVYDYSRPDERQRVESIGKEILRYVERYKDYDFVKFETEKESEGEWCIWTVNFKNSETTQKVLFAMLEINGKYVLGDID